MLANHKFIDWPKELTYLKEDKRSTLGEIREATVVAAGPKPGVIHAFDKPEAFYEWASGLELRDRIREVPRLLTHLRKREDSDLQSIMASQQRRVKAIIEETELVARELGKPVGSPEVLSAITGGDPLRGALFDPMILWDRACGGPSCYGSGTWLPAHSTLPDYRWFGYNDRASHVWASGLNVLCQHIWWRGRWLWVIGAPTTHFDLSLVGFDNTASSSLSL